MNREKTLSNDDLRSLGADEAILDEPIELEREDHTPPTDQTVLSDGDLLDKLADRIALHQDTQIDLTEDLQVIGNPRLALRRCLARL
jgi:hypothetical protein